VSNKKNASGSRIAELRQEKKKKKDHNDKRNQIK